MEKIGGLEFSEERRRRQLGGNWEAVFGLARRPGESSLVLTLLKKLGVHSLLENQENI